MEAPDAPLFVDVDGVLLDLWPRLHKLHEDLMGQLGAEPLGLEDFVERKREKASVEEVTGLSRDAAKEYQRRWKQLAEAPAYLELDRWLPQANTALRLLNSRYTVVLVALRRKADAFRAQLKTLEFPSVAQVLVASPQPQAWEVKAGLIQGSPHFTRNGVIVGDTEVDIRAGKDLGLTTIAVRGGMRGDDLLSREGADLTLNGVGELPAALRALYAGGRP